MPAERQPGDGAAEPGEAILRGFPQPAHDPLTPLGQIDQAGKLVDGLRRPPRRGWRKPLYWVGLVLILLPVVALIAICGWSIVLSS